MSQVAHVVGKVEYRSGDGPALEIRQGPVEVVVSDIDATLSWVDEEAHSSAALQLGDFRRYVDEGKIQLDAAEQRDT